MECRSILSPLCRSIVVSCVAIVSAKAVLKEPYDEGEFPSLIDGLRGMSFIEKAVESHKSGNVWLKIEE